MPFLAQAQATRGEARALASVGGEMTYSVLGAKVDALAGQLMALGVGQGQVVALKGYPDRDVIPALHGIWRTGAAVFPMNPGWTPTEEAGALSRVPTELVLLGPGMSAVQGAWRNVGLGEDSVAGIQPLTALSSDASTPLLDPERAEDRRDSTAAVLLTSGTSGDPRTVRLTFGNLLASAEGARERLGLGPDDCWLASLALAHVGGLALVARAAALGSALFLSEGFDFEAVRGRILNGQVTHASLVPAMLWRLLEEEEDPSVPESLRCLLIGGAAADPSLVRRARSRGLPVALTYGLTEASSQVATAPPDLVAEKPSTVGPPLQGTQLRIGAQGQILVRGPTVAPDQVGDDGWLDTGDLGVLDEDGHLRVTGRLTDRIISGGVNVDPAEVEAVLRGHPGIVDAAVVGIPDPRWGERVVAALVLDPEGGPPLSEVESFVRERLSPPKRPKRFFSVPVLPLNQNGKVDSKEVRRLFS